VGFRIDVQAAQGLPVQLDRMREDANRGASDVTDQTQLSYGGVLDAISGSHEQAVGKVRDYLDQLANRIAGNTAQSLRVAFTYYAHTDANAAASLDATYPVGQGDHADGYLGGGRPRLGNGFRDVTEPTDRYQPRPDHSDEFPYQPSPGVLIGPGAMGRHLVITATTLAAKLGHPWDPYEAILKPITGDWNGLRGCTDVFGNVSEAVADMAANAHAAADSISCVWEGNVADGARQHLMELAKALEEAKEPLVKLAEAYEHAAHGARELFNVMCDVLNDLIDGVVEFIAEASAAAATSETVVGGLAFGGMAAYDAYQVYKDIKHMIEVLTKVQAVIELFQSQQHGFGLVNGEGSLPELPTAVSRLPGQHNNVPSNNNVPSMSAAATDPHMNSATSAPTYRQPFALPL
jgi:hypothetical protein